MANEEITKKELLKITGISYGQLYRWKRKGLIPEEWFIKRASFTGQETYFPKNLILSRIDKILELKDEKSLEEIAEIINDNETYEEIKVDTIRKQDIFIHEDLLTQLVTKDTLTFIELVILKIMDNVYSIIENKNTVRKLYNFLNEHQESLLEYRGSIYFFTEDKEIGCMFLKEEPVISYNLESMTRLDYTVLVDNLKLIIFA